MAGVFPVRWCGLILLRHHTYYEQGLMKIIPTGYFSPVLSSKVSPPSSIIMLSLSRTIRTAGKSFNSKVSSNIMSTGILPRLVHDGLNCPSVAQYQLNP